MHWERGARGGGVVDVVERNRCGCGCERVLGCNTNSPSRMDSTRSSLFAPPTGAISGAREALSPSPERTDQLATTSKTENVHRCLGRRLFLRPAAQLLVAAVTIMRGHEHKEVNLALCMSLLVQKDERGWCRQQHFRRWGNYSWTQSRSGVPTADKPVHRRDKEFSTTWQHLYRYKVRAPNCSKVNYPYK